MRRDRAPDRASICERSPPVLRSFAHGAVMLLSAFYLLITILSLCFKCLLSLGSLYFVVLLGLGL
jgi:hypothetical protein